MRKRILALLMGIMTIGAAGAAQADEASQDYVVFRLANGDSVMEKAWVVSSRIIVTTPFETEAYLADQDGVYTGNKSNVQFLTRNRFEWMKVYTSSEDLPISKDIPPEITDAFTGLAHAIEKAGGLDEFRQNVRPSVPAKNKRNYVILVDSFKARVA